jgi:hypothetical protein
MGGGKTKNNEIGQKIGFFYTKYYRLLKLLYLNCHIALYTYRLLRPDNPPSNSWRSLDVNTKLIITVSHFDLYKGRAG